MIKPTQPTPSIPVLDAVPRIPTPPVAANASLADRSRGSLVATVLEAVEALSPAPAIPTPRGATKPAQALPLPATLASAFALLASPHLTDAGRDTLTAALTDAMARFAAAGRAHRAYLTAQQRLANSLADQIARGR